MTYVAKGEERNGNGLGSKPTLGVNRSARKIAAAAGGSIATNESGTSSSVTGIGMGSRAVEDRPGETDDVSRTSDSPVCVQENVHTPIGLCGVTAWNTVAVAFEPAGPGSTPPAWSNSGESVQGEYHMRPTTSKLLLADLYVPILCPFCVCSLKRAIIVETVHLNIEFPEELSPEVAE